MHPLRRSLTSGADFGGNLHLSIHHLPRILLDSRLKNPLPILLTGAGPNHFGRTARTLP